MSWLNLLTPSAAVIAIFLAIALVVQSFRHGRAIRRLEQQLASSGLSANDPALRRLKELSGVAESSRAPRASRAPRGSLTEGRRPLIIAALVAAVVVIAVAAWLMLSGGSSSTSTTSASTKTITRPTATKTTRTTSTSAAPADPCAKATPLGNTSGVTVSVYNGSGIPGAAGKVVGPKLSSLGYSLGTIANAPNGATALPASVVQYVGTTDLNAACSVATALGVPVAHVTKLTVVPVGQAGTSSVVVLVGKDIAS